MPAPPPSRFQASRATRTDQKGTTQEDPRLCVASFLFFLACSLRLSQ